MKQNNYHAFMKWLKKNNAYFPDIYLKKYHNHERGVHASKNINKQSEVIMIPKSILIYSNMGKSTPMGKKLIQSHEHISNLVYIALYMITDMNQSNKFKAYYDILPNNLTNFPIFWSEKELTFLENSTFKKEIKERKNMFGKEYNILTKHIKNFSQLCNLRQYMHLRVIIGSRNFALTIEGESQPTMVPLGDMLNHAIEPDVSWSFDAKKNGFLMTSKKHITINQAITDSYGLKSNRKYLLYYGFTSDSFSNHIDSISIKFKNLHQPKTLRAIKIKYLKNNEFIDDIQKNIANSSLHNLLSWARINVANKDELSSIQHKYTQYSYIKPISKRNEVAALLFIIQHIKQQLNKYTYTLKENKNMISKYPKGSNIYFAIKLVIYEKEILHSLSQFLNMAVEKLLFKATFSPNKLTETQNNYMRSIKIL